MKRYVDLRQLNLLDQLTEEDFRALVLLLTPNPNNSLTKELTHQAISVLSDWSRLPSKLAKFSVEDAQQLIMLYRDQIRPEEASQLIYQLHLKDQRLSNETYNAMVEMLALKGDISNAEGWIKTMQSKNAALSMRTGGAMLIGLLEKGYDEKAINFLKENPGNSNITMALEYEDNALLDIALNDYFHCYLKIWRLDECRVFYFAKQKRDLSTSIIVKCLIVKALYTRQYHIAFQLLKDAQERNDTKSIKHICEKMVNFFLAQKNSTLYLRVLDAAPEHISEDTYSRCLKHLVHGSTISESRIGDALRIYRQCYAIHSPTNIMIYTSVLGGFLATKRYTEASIVFEHLREKVHRVYWTDVIYQYIYKLCAQIGDSETFRSVFDYQCITGSTIRRDTYTSLMACYLTAKDHVSAKSVFQIIATNTDGPDAVDFNLLIRATTMENEHPEEKISEILEHMKTADVIPDQTTLRTLYTIYGEGQLANRLLKQLLNDPHATQKDEIWINNMILTEQAPQALFGATT
ncbi:hypothetical protein BDF14DRAFT_418369 [Spinellus fusiger]|nr:hypothetical protein BDF14DRAFT_418369 [Spinellus fusiger]